MKRKTMGMVGAGAALLSALSFGGQAQAQSGTTTTPTVAAKVHASKQTKAERKRATAEQRATRALREAYQRLAAYQRLQGNATATQTQLYDKAKALYQTASGDFGAKRFEQAAARAHASASATTAAITLRRADAGATTVPDVTPPPAAAPDKAKAAVQRELTRVQQRIGAANAVSSKAGADASFYLGVANDALTQAQTDFNAGRYREAAVRLHAAKSAANTVILLAHAADLATNPNATQAAPTD